MKPVKVGAIRAERYLVQEGGNADVNTGWQDRLWARWTPLDGQERDDLNPGHPPLRTRCRSASLGVILGYLVSSAFQGAGLMHG